jgi:hypothetical protein
MSNLQEQHTSPLYEGFHSDNKTCDENKVKTYSTLSIKDSNSENQHQPTYKQTFSGDPSQHGQKDARINPITSCDNEDIKSEDDPFFPWHDGFRTRESSILSELSVTSSLVSSASSCICNIKSKESLSSNSQQRSNFSFCRTNSASVDSKRAYAKTSPPVPRPKTLSLSGFTKFWRRNRKTGSSPSQEGWSPVSCSVPLQSNHSMDPKLGDVPDYEPSSVNPSSPVTTPVSESYYRHNRSSSNGSEVQALEDHSVPKIQYQYDGNSSTFSTPMDESSPYALWSPNKDEASEDFCKHYNSHLNVDHSVGDFRSLDGTINDFGKKESKAINIAPNSPNINNQGQILCPKCGKIERESRRKSQSRLSLNLPEMVIGRSPLRGESPSRSPTRSFPRFLRSSLSKLIGSTTSINKNALESAKSNIDMGPESRRRESCRNLFAENNENEQGQFEIATDQYKSFSEKLKSDRISNENSQSKQSYDEKRFSQEIISPSSSVIEDEKTFSPPETTGFIPNTPLTQAYLEETRLRELPLIPFAYPSAAIVEKISERTREMCRDNSNSMDCSPMTDLKTRTEIPENSIKNLAQSVRNAAVLPTVLTESGPNNNSLSKSYHITLDPLDLAESLNYQPTEHHTLENIVDLAHQELLQQHQEDSTMIDLYEEDELSSVGSVSSLAFKPNFVGGIGCNNNIILARRPHNGYSTSSNDHHAIIGQEDNLAENSNSYHMFLDFKDQTQPTFAPKDFDRKPFNHDNTNVEPYVEMTRK